MYIVNFVIEKVEKNAFSTVYVKIYENGKMIDDFYTSFIKCCPFVKEWKNTFIDGQCTLSAVIRMADLTDIR